MKVSQVNPDSSLVEDIATIESNTGIADYEPKPVEVKTKAQSNADRQAEGAALIKSIEEKEKKRADTIANFNTMNNTQIKDVTDVSSLDLTSVCDVNAVDLEAAGLPNPEDYGKTREEVMDMTGVDGREWPLPTPDLANLDPGCFDLDDMYLSNLIDLDGMDMRGWDLPSFDFSWATDWDFPDWMDPSNVSSGDLFDFSGIDLSGIIDLSDISLPDWDIPGDWDFDWDFDTSFEFDGLKGIFDGMGSDGDLLGMGSLSKMFNGISCIGATILDICTPDAIGDVLANFEMPDFSDEIDAAKDWISDLLDGDADLPDIAGKLDLDGVDFDFLDGVFEKLDIDMPFEIPGAPDIGKEELSGPIIAAFGYLGDEWWWYDKETKKYNYDLLSGISPYLLWHLKKEPNYTEIVHATVGMQLYRDPY